MVRHHQHRKLKVHKVNLKRREGVIRINALNRGLRTLVQAFVGGVVASNTLSGLSVGALTNVSELQKFAIALGIAGTTGVVTYVHNYLEDKGYIPKVRK